jgi:DsbC/DsbD-like thiol-disulfide interchange protein
MRIIVFTFLSIIALVAEPSIIFAALGDNLVHATLLADVSAIQPGQTFNVGVLLKIDPGWHIYWKNPGDSGLATKVKLELPRGFSSGAVEYPIPTRIDLPGDIVNFAYENETMLVIPVTAPTDLPSGGPVAISAKISWLVCKELCTPGKAVTALELPIFGDNSSANTELFQQWNDRMPIEHDTAHIADISTSQKLELAPSNALAGPAEIVVRWKSVPANIQWFPASFAGVNITDIKTTTQRNITTVSYHVNVGAEAKDFHGLESVLEYTIPGGQQIGLKVGGQKN